MGVNVDYLIIGNSAAGVTAAETIRMFDADSSIAIIANEPYPAYGTPLISYLIEGKTTEEKVFSYKSADFYEKNNIQTYFDYGYEAVKLDATQQTVTCKNGEVFGYGDVLVATGSTPFVPPTPGIDNRSNVVPFITFDHGKKAWDLAIKATSHARAQGRYSNLVIIGAGLIGLKAAESLSYHMDNVRVLELAPRILPAVLDTQGAAVLQEQLERHGVVCTPGITAEELCGEGDAVTSVKLTDGTEIPCDLLIAAVGVRPNSSLAVEAGAEQGRGLICDEHMQTTLPHVYAAGDVTQVHNTLDGSDRPLALWPNAIRQGRIAGMAMAGKPFATYPGNYPVNAVDVFESTLLTAGIINPPEDQDYEIHIVAEGDTYAKFVVKDNVLQGYILLNRPEGAGIYTDLIEKKTPLDTVSEDLFQDAPGNLEFGADARWARLHKGYPFDMNRYGWKERA